MKLLQGLSPWLALSAVILILTSSVKARVALSVSSIEDAEVLFDHQADANVTELKLRKREYTWEQALTEGKRLKKLMTGARTQSQWSSARQLEDNGWTLSQKSGDGRIPDYINNDKGGSGPYKSLYIDPAEGLPIIANQNKRFDLCGHKDVAATGAEFDHVYYPHHNAIIGVNNYSPVFKVMQANKGATQKQLKTDILPRSVPEVRQWSDIVFNIWAQRTDEAGTAVASLKYIFKNHVNTEATEDVIWAALARKQPPEEFAPAWPGYTYTPGKDDNDEFTALLGTPHGRGVAYLLADHPTGMGNKRIESIVLFTSEPYPHWKAPNLLFVLTDNGH